MTRAQLAYQQYLRSPRWWLLRRLRLWLDGNRCRLCGSQRGLQAHHRSYEYKGKSFLRELGDLTTLCPRCHGDFHDGD